MTFSKDDFIQNIQEKMSFLVDQYKFNEPIVVHKNMYGEFIYKKNEIAIQGRWETRDQVFEIKMTLLDDSGNVPDVYKMNDRSEIVSGYITEFLMTKGIRDFGGEAKKTENLFDDEIARFVFLVKNYAPEVLEDGSAKNFKGIKLENGDQF